MLGCALLLSISAASARADDLLVLNGDSETLSGAQQFGMVYIDGDLRLSGDTSITASSIYIGPDASVISCFVAGEGDDSCTAGRSLTLQSSGPLTVATPIDLTGGTGPVQPGGNLTLSGTSVAVAGDVTTAGSGGAPSGQVAISSTGTLALGGVDAPGAPVTLNAGGAIDVADGIQTEGNDGPIDGNPAQVQSAGPIIVHSSGGNVRIGGSIQADGGYAPTQGGLAGGNGAAVTITGSDVRTEDITTTGGDSGAAVPGSSAPISITAHGELDALGPLDASGQAGAAGNGARGSSVTLNAAGPLTIGGDADVSGGPSSAGGSIALTGATVTTDQLNATGGDGSDQIPSGGPGGSIRVSAADGASLGKLLAYGGQSYGGTAGAGGSINVSSSAGSIAATSAETEGGYQGDGPGAAGGPIALSAAGNLSVGADVDADGSDAGGQSDPPFNGGNAGSPSRSGRRPERSASAGTRAPRAAPAATPTTVRSVARAAPAARRCVVTHALGALASLSSAGGQGGDDGDSQGPGGRGGALLAFTNAPIFNDQELVSSDGGDGNPTGVAGPQQQDESPTAPVIVPSTGALSFTSQSPLAQRYQVLMSVAGGAAVPVLTTSHTTGLRPKAPVCEPVTFTVEALDYSVGWTSDPSSAVSYRRQPSKSQGCSEAPKVTASSSLSRSLRALRRAHWVATFPVKTNGVGRIEATLVRDAVAPGKAKHGKRQSGSGAKTVATVSLALTSSGTHVLHLALPAAGRVAGSYSLRVTATSPDGKGHVETTFGLEIVS